MSNYYGNFVRSFRGDDPMPYMGIIQSLSFGCHNIKEGTGTKLQRLSSPTPDGGFVMVTRVGDVEYVDVRSKPLYDVFILNTYGSSVVKIFDQNGGALLRAVDPGISGSVISADDSFHLFSYVDYLTASYYSKYDYSGAEIYGVAFDAGAVCFAKGRGAYDVIMGWVSPDPYQAGGNTQWVYLYKNNEYVGAKSYSCTDAHRTEAVSAAINDTGVYVLVRDYDFDGVNESNRLEWVEQYDFDMVYVGKTGTLSSPTTPGLLPLTPGMLEASNDYVVYSYNLGYFGQSHKADLTTPLQFAVTGSDGSYHMPIGVQGSTFYYWHRNAAVDHKVQILTYDLLDSGAYKSTLELSAGDGTLEPGAMAQRVKL